MGAPTTLQEVAAERERLRAALEAAERHRDELEPKWTAALAAVGEAKNALERLDLMVSSAGAAHRIAQAVQELGLATAEPPVVVVPARSPRGLPPVWQLVALSADGKVGLYCHRSPGRRGRMYAIRTEHAPEAVEAKRRALTELGERQQALGRELGYGTQEYREAEARLKRERLQLVQELTALLGVRQVESIGPKRDSGLYAWECRTRGSYGFGEGPLKPLPAPTGGRWRWLKVREQAELEGGE